MTESFETTDAAEAESWDSIAEDGGEYGSTEETAPPDISEALAQMQATIEARLPAEEEEYEDEGEFGIQPGEGAEFSDEELAELAGEYLGDDVEDLDDLDAEELNELIDERVQEAVVPFVAEVEWNRRVERIHELAERYPVLRDTEAVEEIQAQAEQFGEAYGVSSASTDPAIVEMLTQAYAARQAGNAELEAPDQEPGAVLETGVGPSPQTEEMDPQTKAYYDVIRGPKATNVFNT